MRGNNQKNNIEFKYSIASCDPKLIGYIKTVQEKLLIDIACKYYKRSANTKKPGQVSVRA